MSKDVQASVVVGYDNKKGKYSPRNDETLIRLFDRKNETWWTSPEEGCRKVVFSFHPNKPVYIKKITIFNHGNTYPLVGGVIIKQSAGVDSVSVSGKDIKLQQRKEQELDLSESYYAQVLKAGSFDLYLLGCSQRMGKLEIEEINFEFSDAPPLKPEISVNDLMNKIKSIALHDRPGKAWHFADDENEPNKEKYLSHLMYYGMKGDKAAENMFMNYWPSATDLSEEVSELQSWYAETKPHKHQVINK
jgi:hypothetical protein